MLSLLVAFGLIVGIVSGCVSIYEFIRSRQGQGIVYAVVAIGLILSAVLLASLPSLSGVRNVVTTPGSTGNTQPTTGNTSEQTQPTPTPTPTPVPCCGVSVYQSSSDNWQSWGTGGLPAHWMVQGTSLLNDGNGTPPLYAPYVPQSQNLSNYKVVANITLIRLNNTDHSSFGIIARAPSSQGGYSFSICHQMGEVFGTGVHCAGQTTTEALLFKGQNFPDGNGDTVFGHSTFQPNLNSSYTYEIDVKGYTISVFINNHLLFPPQDDLTYPSGGSVGIWSVDCQISVNSLEIITM